MIPGNDERSEYFHRIAPNGRPNVNGSGITCCAKFFNHKLFLRLKAFALVATTDPNRYTESCALNTGTSDIDESIVGCCNDGSK